MSMSDCVQCWSTPCMCGHEYRNWSLTWLDSQIRMLQHVRACRAMEETRMPVADPQWVKWREEDKRPS